MKGMFKQVGAVVLLLLFIGASTGIMVNKMTCLNSGRSVYAVGELDDCCPEVPIPANSVKGQCCDFSQLDFTTDLPFIEVASKSEDAKQPVAVFAAPFKHHTIHKKCCLTYTDLPPPPQRTEDLCLQHSTYLI